jgi:hypothetical protein
MQNDRRFILNSPMAIIPEAPDFQKQEKLCKNCETYVVENDYYDNCDVCRGVRNVGRKPGESLKASGIAKPAAQTAGDWYATVPVAPTPGIAIAALVSSLFIPVLGLVLGYAARKEIRNPISPKDGDGLATAAIVIGWISTVVGTIWVFSILAVASSCTGYYC